MPVKPCNDPRCPNLVQEGTGFCDDHQAEAQAQARPTAHERGYTHTWQQERARHLRQHPLCCDPFGHHARGQRTAEDTAQGLAIRAAATVVDHALPHRQDDRLFWVRELWGPVCQDCHRLKTTSIDYQIPPADYDELERLLVLLAGAGHVATKVITQAVLSTKWSGQSALDAVRKVVGQWDSRR